MAELGVLLRVWIRRIRGLIERQRLLLDSSGLKLTLLNLAWQLTWLELALLNLSR